MIEFLLALVVGLMIAFNVSLVLTKAKESKYYETGVYAAFTIYWTLLMAKIVFNY